MPNPFSPKDAKNVLWRRASARCPTAIFGQKTPAGRAAPQGSRFIFFLLITIMPMIGPGLESRSAAADADALATITIKVTGMRNHNGDLIFGIFTSADGFPTDKSKSVNWQVKPADADTVTFTAKLAPGKYGASVLHDENRNGKMDKNAIGVPLEGYGVTNNPKPRLRAATFAESRFDLPAAGATLTIEIQYF